MDEARQALGRIDDWVARLRDAKPPKKTSNARTSNVQRPTEAFEDALDDDLNISAALGFLFETIRETNRALDAGTLDAVGCARLARVVEPHRLACSRSPAKTPAMPPNVSALGEARAQARLAKEWRKSDELRDEIAALGWEVRDTKDGQKITQRGGAS